MVKAGQYLNPQHELIRRVIHEEICEGIKNIPKKKAPVVDRFPVEFFTRNWEVVKEDAGEVVRYFFKTSVTYHAFNITAITLIRTVPSPTQVKDYRPIVCYSIMYNIISMFLTTRLKTVFANLVGPAHSTFVKRKSTINNILFSHDIFKCYTRNWISPRCVLRVDLRKAYDTLEWRFLRNLLVDMGFPPKCIQWIMTCVYIVS